MSRRYGNTLIWRWLGLLIIVAVLVIEIAPHIMYNFTPSMPMGFYWIWKPQNAIRTGDIVMACVPLHTPAAQQGIQRHYLLTSRGALRCPGGVYPVVKPVVAVSGDLVSLARAGVSVNGKLLPDTRFIFRDPQGRPVWHMPFKTYHVRPGYFWLVSGLNPLSFDSRYWGPVSRADILRRAVPFLTFTWHPAN
ncbi:conjugative transfer signal peptidase TraF [Acidithiobacillus thiooxidans]|uniref:conjugative transfer signal peptidase TraF n=1 Tax=Acidithiobacillus thiooxidans TaxID=930 RepID=UPI001C066606|nr:conjugative transfer signal peptidase TraF [Acidithiobacillus thiooxidans]MBU2834417.1 conjugative transfer signal peptidase TraF [Acidithiobacillus thiooxidans]